MKKKKKNQWKSEAHKCVGHPGKLSNMLDYSKVSLANPADMC